MAVMTQDQMKELVRGGGIVDDSSMDAQLSYITSIAIAALGDDIEELREAIRPYADELEELVRGANYFAKQFEDEAAAHIVWLRSL